MARSQCLHVYYLQHLFTVLFCYTLVLSFASRFAELGHAIVRRVLVDRVLRPTVHYCGFLFGNKEATNAISDVVYKWWDENPSSPPKAREREPLPDPQLQLLAWQDHTCLFPAALYHKFAAGTAGHKRLKELQAELEQIFPPPAAVPGSSTRVIIPRAGGRPDFSIEGGQRPLDVSREIDLPVIAAAAFNEPRCGTCRHSFFLSSITCFENR